MPHKGEIMENNMPTIAKVMEMSELKVCPGYVTIRKIRQKFRSNTNIIDIIDDGEFKLTKAWAYAYREKACIVCYNHHGKDFAYGIAAEDYPWEPESLKIVIGQMEIKDALPAINACNWTKAILRNYKWKEKPRMTEIERWTFLENVIIGRATSKGIDKDRYDIYKDTHNAVRIIRTYRYTCKSNGAEASYAYKLTPDTFLARYTKNVIEFIHAVRRNPGHDKRPNSGKYYVQRCRA